MDSDGKLINTDPSDAPFNPYETLRTWTQTVLSAVCEDVEMEDPHDPSDYSVRTYTVAKKLLGLLDHPLRSEDRLDVSPLARRVSKSAAGAVERKQFIK